MVRALLAGEDIQGNRKVVSRLGFEPRTPALKGQCSTVELPAHDIETRAYFQLQNCCFDRRQLERAGKGWPLPLPHAPFVDGFTIPEFRLWLKVLRGDLASEGKKYSAILPLVFANRISDRQEEPCDVKL